MDHVAVWCGYTLSTTSDCFSSPVHQYFTRPFKESIVLRLAFEPAVFRKLLSESESERERPSWLGSF
jgi:hypothetical protein